MMIVVYLFHFIFSDNTFNIVYVYYKFRNYYVDYVIELNQIHYQIVYQNCTKENTWKT